MDRISLRIMCAAVCAGLLALGLPAQAATIVAGSGAKPPATATGIYEIAVATTDSRRMQTALALVHNGALKEVHSRSSAGYQRREAGSSAIRVSTGTYDQLLALAGGTNRDVNTLPLATRCRFYSLAAIPTTSMDCPTSTLLPATTSPVNGACPSGYALKLVLVNGTKQLRCVLLTRVPPALGPEARLAAVRTAQPPGRSLGEWIERLIPISTAEARMLQFSFKSELFAGPLSFSYLSPEAGGTDYGGWRFDGFGFQIIWANDGP